MGYAGTSVSLAGSLNVDGDDPGTLWQYLERSKQRGGRVISIIMDNGINLSPETAQNLQKLTDKDKQDLNQFIMAESMHTCTICVAVEIVL